MQQTPHTSRYIPANTNRGWGVALLVIVLAVIINSTAAYIHYTTSARTPNDVEFRAKGAR